MNLGTFWRACGPPRPNARSCSRRIWIIPVSRSFDHWGTIGGSLAFKVGKGVIVRVGDRTSIFDSEAMRFLAEVAAGLKGKRNGFQYQRGLMGGGTCEATAYQEFGLQTAAVCVSLGNYHNCAPGNRIEAEY